MRNTWFKKFVYNIVIASVFFGIGSCALVTLEERIQPSIIEVHSSDYGCTAFYISSNELQTAAHCVRLPLRDSENNSLQLLSIDRSNDTALLRSPVKGEPLVVYIGPFHRYEEVVACGYPAYGARISSRYSCEWGRTMGADKFFLYTSDMSSPGMSGGPLLNADGEVLGVVSGFFGLGHRVISKFGRMDVRLDLNNSTRNMF